MSNHPIGTKFSFAVSTPPASKKNGRRVFRAGNRLRFVPSSAAIASEAEVAAAARQATGGTMPFDRCDALRLDYTHDIETDAVQIVVTKIGTLPEKSTRKQLRGTKRDVHGMLETIADALQGVLYPDDDAVDAGSYGRVR